MSDKMDCPGCGSYLSSVLRDFREGNPMGCCGLSREAANEIIAIRARRANTDVTATAEAAIRRADTAERDAKILRAQLDDIRRVLDRKPASDTW